MELTFRASVLLSVQGALLDLVTPNLRGLAVEIAYPAIGLRFVTEDVPRELDLENASLVETYVIADFGADVSVAATVEHLPLPRPRDVRPGEVWAYLRQEINELGPSA